MTEAEPIAPLVRCEIEAGVATLTLDSPHNRNALSAALVGELVAALTQVSGDDRVRVVVLTHTGPVFCSGVDLKETAAARSAGQIPASSMGGALAAVWECPKPVVARVGGPARAGGLGLVAAADIAVATTAATFAATEVRLGVIPAVISAVVLPRLTPRGAAELFLTGNTIDGVRAEQVGLVTRAVPADDLDAAVSQYTQSLVRGAPGALAATKALIHGGLTAVSGSTDSTGAVRSIREQLEQLSELSVRFFTSAEGREGVASFLEKRDPAWVPR